MRPGSERESGRLRFGIPRRLRVPLTLRAFLAIPVTEPALSAYRRLLVTLRDRIPSVGWARPGAAHFTLRFFGSLPDEQVPEVIAAVRPAVQPNPRFELELSGWGGFPSRRRARVLWLGIARGGETLSALAGACDASLGRIGFDREPRPFRPHLTVGRPRGELTPSALGECEEVIEAALPLPPFTATEVVLFQSFISSRGAGHEPLERISLP